MAIKNIKERLEGSYRLIRIRRIKNIFFVIQMIIAAVLGLLVSFFMGANSDPFFFPVDAFSFTFLVIILIMSIEAIYFKGLEIKYTRNKSRRYLVARNSIRRSGIIIAVAGIMVLLMLMPYTQDYITETHAPPQREVPVGILETQISSFQAQGSLGMARASRISLTSADEFEVSIVRGEASGVEIWNPGDYDTQFQWGGLGDYTSEQSQIVVWLYNPNPYNISVSYSVQSEISPFICLYLPAMSLAFIIIQLISVSIMYPVRERYAKSSIYSKRYVGDKDMGEYVFKPGELTKEDEEEQEILDSTLDIDMPPPPPKKVRKMPGKAVPPPPEGVEMARAKGRVDQDLIEEEDVECANCGELNSAHSALCFSCGEEILGKEEKKVDTGEYLRKGMAFARANKYRDAIACYDEVLKHDKANQQTLVKKGEALYRQGKWGSAVQYVNTALQLNPRDIDALILKAEILDDRGRLDKSMDIYSLILSIDPENEKARKELEQVSQEAALESVEDVLEQFMCIPGVGLARATKLYDAGYTSVQALEDASETNLSDIKGISKGLAKKIKKGLKNL